MFLTDDADLLDKIECCQAHLIQPYLNTKFSHVSPVPTFQAHGVEQKTCIIPGHTAGFHLPAHQALQALGF